MVSMQALQKSIERQQELWGVEDIGVITSVGDQNAVPERRREMIESGFASEKLNESGIKEKFDVIREFGRKL